MNIRWWFLAALVGCIDAHPDTGVADTDVGDTDPTPDTDTDDTGEPTGLALAGHYTDSWGTQHVITETTWTQTYPNDDQELYHVQGYDNDERWVVAQNDVENAWNGGLYSRFDWHRADDDSLWYCQSAFAAQSADEAQAATPADPADLDAGCGGFSWTALTP